MTNPFWLNVRDLDVDALAELGSSTEGIQQKQAVGVAFQRLQTKAMQDAAEAQIGAASDQQRAAEAAIRAAKAAEETAKYTRDSSRWNGAEGRKPKLCRVLGRPSTLPGGSVPVQLF